jgi:hypothetical protein
MRSGSLIGLVLLATASALLLAPAAEARATFVRACDGNACVGAYAPDACSVALPSAVPPPCRFIPPGPCRYEVVGSLFLQACVLAFSG